MTIRLGTSGWRAVISDEFMSGKSPERGDSRISELCEVVLSKGRALGPIYETPVGFKYIGELINENKINSSGEESAGLSLKGHSPEKDGIVAGLLAAEAVATRGQNLTRRVGEIG